ncbi:AAA family ATPase [Nocardia beijingensis]|nr:AAA family ATPase [Nocardia beijingensis]
MYFRSLRIENFRGIRLFEVNNLSDFVMVAGPNGCGKSCVFDAIRLLKSVYGGYQVNEWHHFFSELQIDINNPAHVKRLFRDPSLPIRIVATVELPVEEREYVRAHADEILEPWLWMMETGQDVSYRRFAHMVMASPDPVRVDLVKQRVRETMPSLLEALDRPTSEIGITIEPGKNLIESIPNIAAALVFATYDPGNIGVIEYHSASRAYNRETVGGIDLNTQNFEDQRRQSSLYNWQNKYTNIKTELAATYLRGLVAREASQDLNETTVNDTIKEMFNQFFPDKEYLGVLPETGGGLTFPVRLKSGETHDINELSSGEKEIVYGYLRLRNSAPKFSTVLLDEPELHLNPGLLRGLVQFYHQHLGKEQQNQLWLVTHSDALLRQAVSSGEGFSVYHMTPMGAAESASDNQAIPVLADDDLKKATIAIVGDLASFKPTGRIVIVEGGGDSEFDASVLERLAPEFAARVNIVSGGDKTRVKALYDTLEKSGDKFGSAGRFFAIVDRDFEQDETPQNARTLNWNVYHIENYLLNDKYILSAVNTILGRARFDSTVQVADALRDSAKGVIDPVLFERVKSMVNSRIVSAIKLGGRSDAKDPSMELSPSIDSTFKRLEGVRKMLTETDAVQAYAEEERQRFESAIDDGSWREILPGRLILKRFANDILAGKSSYETLRNVILAGMETDSYCPEGMKQIIDSILATPIEAE